MDQPQLPLPWTTRKRLNYLTIFDVEIGETTMIVGLCHGSTIKDQLQLGEYGHEVIKRLLAMVPGVKHFAVIEVPKRDIDDMNQADKETARTELEHDLTEAAEKQAGTILIACGDNPTKAYVMGMLNIVGIRP